MGGGLNRFLIFCPILGFALAQCQPDNFANNNAPKPKRDFLKTEIVSAPAGVADGTSTLKIVLSLKNSDGSPVSGFRPTYTTTPNQGIVEGSCTLSDNNGFASCPITSRSSGIKTFRLSNAKVGLKAELNFSAPDSQQNSAIVTSGSVVNGATSDGYRISVSVGGAVQGYNSTTLDNYHLVYFFKGGTNR